jgi:MFS family permease
MTQSQDNKLSMVRILLLGGLLVTLSMGIRHGFGLFNLPITTANGWGRETFAFAIALQNLMWGISQPFTGALADRFGSFRVMLIGAILYIGGLLLMATTSSAFTFTVGAGLLIGLAQSASTYSIVYGLIGRNVSPEKRVWAMGVAAAAGSFGQFLMIPVEQGLISGLGPNDALLILALLATLLIPLALGLKEPKTSFLAGSSQTISEALKEAFSTRSFQLLTLGYFVCGFQVVFIGVHLAPYLKDMSAIAPAVGNPQVATISLALIGLFNVFGTFYAGVLGQRFPKRYLLSAIYVTRSIVIIGFLLLPLSPVSTYIFAALMGLLWLSTVPLTNGLVAQIFGVKYLSMLSGVVFFSHQIGSFMGAYLGGYLFDKTGSYNVVWMIAIALGAFAGVINLPIKEQSVIRTQAA